MVDTEAVTVLGMGISEDRVGVVGSDKLPALVIGDDRFCEASLDPTSRGGLSRGTKSSITLDLRAFVLVRVLDSDPDPAEKASVSKAPVFLEWLRVVLFEVVGVTLLLGPDEY